MRYRVYYKNARRSSVLLIGYGGLFIALVQGLPVCFNQTAENAEVERYRSPVSGRRTTILLPKFSGCNASCFAAAAAAPEEMPTSKPSVFAISFAVSNASSFVIRITPS